MQSAYFQTKKSVVFKFVAFSATILFTRRAEPIYIRPKQQTLHLGCVGRFATWLWLGHSKTSASLPVYTTARATRSSRYKAFQTSQTPRLVLCTCTAVST
ncbi:hypothetical protein BaRGS_00009958 [Batillaria attramentaria]|uniref:Secreted protein n=1 Tax=Batillaria attramentaria TaxID=370345 RepID=A0ABD0LH97_9CAEN